MQYFTIYENRITGWSKKNTVICKKKSKKVKFGQISQNFTAYVRYKNCKRVCIFRNINDLRIKRKHLSGIRTKINTCFLIKMFEY